MHGGITPAYAGKSGTFAMPQFTQRDHPRLCGEKRCTGNFSGHDDGSPPPMRGKVKPFLCPLCHKGITPAYAGKSLFTFRKVMRLRDHPRLCGEKLIAISIFLCASGSPPPMRGKVVRYDEFAFYSGITPAYAGKSLSGLSVRLLYRDHPRLCGEKPFWFVSAITLQGSPPPMRGKALNFSHTVKKIGITPAYAGKRRVRYGRSR